MAKVEVTDSGFVKLVNNKTGQQELLDPGEAAAAIGSGAYSAAPTSTVAPPAKSFDANVPVSGVEPPPDPDSDWNLGEMAQVAAKRALDGFTTVSALIESEEQRRLAEKYPIVAALSEGAGMIGSTAVPPLALAKIGKVGGIVGKGALALAKLAAPTSTLGKIALRGSGVVTDAARSALASEFREQAAGGEFDPNRVGDAVSEGILWGAVGQGAGTLIASVPSLAKYASSKITKKVKDSLDNQRKSIEAAVRGERLKRVLTPAEDAQLAVIKENISKLDQQKSGFAMAGEAKARAQSLERKASQLDAKIKAMGARARKVDIKKLSDLREEREALDGVLSSHFASIDEVGRKQRNLREIADNLEFQPLPKLKSDAGSGMSALDRAVRLGGGTALGAIGMGIGGALGQASGLPYGHTIGTIAGASLGGKLGRQIADPIKLGDAFGKMSARVSDFSAKHSNTLYGRPIRAAGRGIGAVAGATGSVIGAGVRNAPEILGKAGAMSPNVGRTPDAWYSAQKYINDKNELEYVVDELQQKTKFFQSMIDSRGGDPDEVISYTRGMEAANALLKRIGSVPTEDQLAVRNAMDDVRLTFDPDYVLEVMKKNQLTPDRIDLIRTVSPAIYDQLRSEAEALRADYAASGAEPTGQDATNIRVILGTDVGRGLNSSAGYQRYQQVLSSGLNNGQGQPNKSAGSNYTPVGQRPGVTETTRLQGG